MITRLKTFLRFTTLLLATALMVAMPQVHAFTENDYFSTQQSTPFYDPTCNVDAPSAAAPLTGTSTNKSVYIMGDSITAITKDAYTKALTDAGFTPTIEGLSSRHISASPPSPSGLGQIDADKATIAAAGTVVIALGTNDSSESADKIEGDVHDAVQKVKAYAIPSTKIYWVNILNDKHDADSRKTNTAITAGVGSDATVIDWYSEAKAKATTSSFDIGVHPTKPDDIKLLADLVTKTLSGDAATADASASPTTNACCNTSTASQSSAPASSGSKLEHEIAIFDNLVGTMGFSVEQAYGIMGNLSVESGFDPTKYYPGTTTDNPVPDRAFGIAQWRLTRQTALRTMAEKAGKKITDFDTQLKYLDDELTNQSYKTSVADPIKALTGDEDSILNQSADIWNNHFEVSESPTGPRAAAAKAVKSDLKGHTPPATATATPAATTTDTSSSAVCCPPTTDTAAAASAAGDSSPSDWVKMYTGANKAKVDHMARGHLNKSDIKILVIHYTQGIDGGQALLDFFNTQITGIQFHIDSAGKIYQYYPLTDMQRTNHVGNANGKSIGIEIAAKDVDDLMGNDAQFQSVVSLSKYLCDYYDIPCSQPKGDITGDGVATAQGMLGHDETPEGGHSDPDAKVGPQYPHKANEKEGVEPISRTDSTKHPYMIKLRTAMGFDPTPGHTGGTPSAPTTTDTSTGATIQCGQTDTTAATTDGDPVGESANKALAMEAIKYGTTANNGKYKYVWGGLHGDVAQLKSFRDSGGGADCIGFVRYIIWKVYGTDISGMTTHGVPTSPDFTEVTNPNDVQAGDIGWTDGHVDFITKNLGDGKFHEFGAHSEETGIHGGEVTAATYTKFYRFTGTKGTGR